MPAEGKVVLDGVNVAKRHAKPTRNTMQGGDHRQVHADARLGGVDPLQVLRGTHPGGLRLRRAGAQDPGLPQVRGRAVTTVDPARPRLKERYLAEVRGRSAERARPGQRHAGPAPEKIVINMGVGKATQQQSLIEGAQRDLEMITGQKPVVTRAKKSIAGFKLREGKAIGVKVTLRGDRAWEFFDRLISLAIPRIRDFRGLSPRSFDGHGNYTFGVTEQLIFPEVDYDRIDTIRGMDITIVTTARTDEEGRALLRAFGFPFRQETR